MRHIDHELKAAAAVLALLERNRAETGDDTLGSDIERLILNRCVTDLESTADSALVLCRKKRKEHPDVLDLRMRGEEYRNNRAGT